MTASVPRCNCKVSAGMAAFHQEDCAVMTASPAPALLTKELESAMYLVREATEGRTDGIRLSSKQATALLQHIAALEQRVEADSKDAERYRWLKEQRRWYYNLPPTPGISLTWENFIAGPAYWLDAAIDAARAQPNAALPKEPR